MRFCTTCHSRVSGNPEPRGVQPSLDARFRGHDNGVSESPSFSMTQTTSGSISNRSAAGIDVGPRVPASNLVLVDVLNHLVQRRRERLVFFVSMPSNIFTSRSYIIGQTVAKA